MTKSLDWATSSGDLWAELWRETDAALAALAPRLQAAIVARAPATSFRALDIGCGPGSTTLALAEACPQASITACDISPALVELVRHRTDGISRIRALEGDAERLAEQEGPFDLLFSRHGVMFFTDPVRAFRALRRGTAPGGSLVFSCFREWRANPWASELAGAAAGRALDAPGREPGPFAFADPDHVRDILAWAGWTGIELDAVDFPYLPAAGADAVDRAVAFLAVLGPASRVLKDLPEKARGPALDRMRSLIEAHFDGSIVAFPAAAWIVTVRRA